jgi:ATP-binding cassette subfamily B protein
VPTPAKGEVHSVLPGRDWETLKRLFPYLWEYKWRVLAALLFMIGAKVANVGVPMLLKKLVDTLNTVSSTSNVTQLASTAPLNNDPNKTNTVFGFIGDTLQSGLHDAFVLVPAALLIAYALLRLSVSAFTELRELVFAKATQGAARRIALETFNHLHGMSLRFHLERQTGGMTRDIERGVKGIESLISYSLYSIIPTLIEVTLVLGVMAVQYDVWFAVITLLALAFYIYFTVVVTEWRTQFRREANEYDSAAHSRAVDSLLNYETVKYFGNETFEADRYDKSLVRLRDVRLKAQRSLSLLNTGQQFIIATALVAILWRATLGVVEHRLSLGDLVMINAFMIQLYIPLNFLGMVYREIKQSLTDLDKMFALLDKNQEIADASSSVVLALTKEPRVSFEGVNFGYESNRQILKNINFTIPSGKTVAVVGPSGSGKSTLARLMFRFYDIQSGAIKVNDQDIRGLTQASLRRAIGIVPQDTVLFNDTVYYNIAYGRPTASKAEVEEAAKAARIHDFIVSTPKGYETMVGERGLKLSGGEKQRVAIARTLLKSPQILIFDEATSALDSANERAIQAELQTAAQNKTTLVIAHRLSTVVDAHEILVMDAGEIVERGAHHELLQQNGRYAVMWAMQQSAEVTQLE